VASCDGEAQERRQNFSVSRKKMRVRERQHTCPLDQKATSDSEGDVGLNFRRLRMVLRLQRKMLKVLVWLVKMCLW
jgi:hypothetical protein